VILVDKGAELVGGAAPAKPPVLEITLVDLRRMLHSAQIMRMNPRYSPREVGILANLDRRLRWSIRRKLEMGP
jgi:hypothetical protein